MMRKNSRPHEIDMTEGPIMGKMLMFSLPLMASIALQLLFNTVNVIVVGNFSGEEALAAVGSTGSLVALITNIFIGLSVGANVVAARSYGARREDQLSATVHTAILLSLFSGVILTFVGVLGARAFLKWMRTPDDVIDLAATYLRIYFLGITSTMVYNFGAAVLRAIGDTKRPLYFLLFAGAVNVALNLAFVVWFRMSVAGVAVATVISQTIAAALILLCLTRSDGAMRLDLKKLRIDREIFVRILRVGLPAGLQGSMFSISNVIIQSSINSYGSVVVAGNSAAASIEAFVYVAMNALHQTAISFTSQNLGAGRIKRIWKVLWYAQGAVLIAGLVLGNLACAFGRPLLDLYTNSKDSAAVIAAGQVRLNVIARMYTICGAMDVMVGMLRGIGLSIVPMIVSLIGVCGLRLVWVRYVAALPVFGGITGIYASYPVSWGVTFLAHAVTFVWAMRRIQKKSGGTLGALPPDPRLRALGS